MSTLYTRLLAALLVLGLLLGIAPVCGASTYYVVENAVQGYYYAVYTGGQPYNAFYMNGASKAYITTYWWDANQSYIIFQSPINGTIFLEPSTAALNTFSTSSIVGDESPPADEYTVTVAADKFFGSANATLANVTEYTKESTFNGTALTVLHNFTYTLYNTTITLSYNYAIGEENIIVNATLTYDPSVPPATFTLSSTARNSEGTGYWYWGYNTCDWIVPVTINIVNESCVQAIIGSRESGTDIRPSYWDFSFTFNETTSFSATTTVVYPTQSSNGTSYIVTENAVIILLSLDELPSTDGSVDIIVTKQPNLDYYLPGQTVNITFTAVYRGTNVVISGTTDVYVNAAKVATVSSYPSSILVSVNPWGVTQIDFVSQGINGASTQSVFLYPEGYQVSLEPLEIPLNASGSASIEYPAGNLTLPDYLKLAGQAKTGLYALSVLPLLFLLVANRVWSGIAILLTAGIMAGVNHTLGQEFFSNYWIGVLAVIGVLALFTEARGGGGR